LIIINFGHHLEVQEAMALIARPSTTPTPQTWVLSGNFSKEIITEIREAKDDMGWPDLLVSDVMVMIAADDCRG
jgi:hypothetical protein